MFLRSECWNVGADRQLNDRFARVGRVVVVLRKAFADFAGGDADDGVGIGVIAWGAAEDLDANTAFLQFGRVAAEGLLDDIAEQRRIALAVGEERMSLEPFELGADRGRIGGGPGQFQLLDRFRRPRHVVPPRRLAVALVGHAMGRLKAISAVRTSRNQKPWPRFNLVCRPW